MDNRIANLVTTRPGRLRKQDLPDLASALVGYWKGLGSVGADSVNNIPYVRLHGDTFEVTVTGEDWVKVLPYLQDGTLGPEVFPSPRFNVGGVKGKDFGDPILYNRTLSTLTLIFKDAESYPVQRQVAPGTVPGLFARFDASRPGAVSLNGFQVSLWKDSVRGQSAFQGTPSLRPTYNPTALNNLPGIEFNGTQWLELPLLALSDWSVILIGKYQTSVSQTVGGFLTAAGYEGLGSGIDCYVKQNSAVSPLPGPQGRLTTWLYGYFAPISPYNDAVNPDEFKVLYWAQSSKNPGGSRARIGLHPDVDLALIVGNYNLANEGWDPTRQRAGQPSPLRGAIGRYNGFLAGGPGFYLQGTICEILIYNRVLSTGEYSTLANELNTKWGGALL